MKMIVMLGEVVCVRELGVTAWRVIWRGRLCSPVWLARGPADAYLDALRRGTRSPEFQHKRKGNHI